jgi:hypothetical protein
MDNQKVKVSILGKSYLVSTDEKDDVLRAAEMVDKVLKQNFDVDELSSLQGKDALYALMQMAIDVIKKEKLLHSYQHTVDEILVRIDNEASL